MKKQGTDRIQKSSKDPIMGRLVEELIIYLLYEYFDHNKLRYEILNSNTDKKIIDTFKIVHGKMKHEKIFDMDIIIFNQDKKDLNQYYLLSCKGSVRERIGQYIANLFLMDDRLIKTKYNDRYYLDFHTKGKIIKYGLVSLDWAKNKDFIKKSKTGKTRETVKQTEVYLINDDIYIGGGVTVFNNLENLDHVLNFGELVGRISNFLN